MKEKKLKLITQILAILVICLVSFVGIYTQNTNKVENSIKNYNLGNDLVGYRELVLKVSDAVQVVNSDGDVVGNTDNYTDSNIESYSYSKTENKVNPDECLNLDNYKRVKTIIENRLKTFGVTDYKFSLNNDNGTINLQIPETSSTDHTISNILQVAKFEIKDSEDNSKIYLTNNDLKKASAVYNTTTAGTTVYLQLELTKNGADILKELSEGEYVTIEEDNTTQNETTNDTIDENAVEAEAELSTDGNTSNVDTSEETSNNEDKEKVQKKISILIDDTPLIETSFNEPIENGLINLSMGEASQDVDTINDTLTSASTVATQLNTGRMPVTYTISGNTYIKTDISHEMILKTIIGIGIVTAICLVILIIKYKLKGLIASVAYIGFIALDLLLVRYTNVSISLEVIIAGIIILAINYMLIINILKTKKTTEEDREKENKKQLITWVENLMPIFIISIVFVFTNWDKVIEFGMFMFWGLLISVVYNYLLTKNMLEE